MNDAELAREIARRTAALGGRVYFVGGVVRDRLMSVPCKDIDIEVYGLTPKQLRDELGQLGTVVDKGASFGVLGLKGSDLDIAMPRKERRVGGGHRDFDVSVDPFLPPREASRRRDFTMNALMQDVLTDEIIDHWNGRRDLQEGIIRCVSPETFPEDALRVFRAAQFAARMNARIDPETLALCRSIDVTEITRERVFEETNKALMKAKKPSIYFRELRKMDHLKEFYPELNACIGVEQNPKHHPEGDVFEHTMLVLDCAAELRERAEEPLPFMYSALLHDLGKCIATQRDADGKITSHGHEVLGTPLVEKQMQRLTNNVKIIRYVVNQAELHMRPNMLAAHKSKKKKSRAMFDLSVCPNDLILLSRADASGKTDEPYNVQNEVYLRQRLEDYREIMTRPMVTGADLIAAGMRPGEDFKRWLDLGKKLHFAGIEKKLALKQILAEAKSEEYRSKKS